MRRRADIPAAALAVLRDQDGVITRRQALAAGATDDHLKRWLATGTWQRGCVS